MKRIILAALALMCAALPAAAQDKSPPEHERRAIERRAVEAVIWGMPVVNYDLMLQEMLTKTAGKVNQVIYWGRPLDWKNQTLTPNPDALYFIVLLRHQERGRSCSTCRRAARTVRSTPTSSRRGRCRSKTRGCSASTRARACKLLMLPPGYKGATPAPATFPFSPMCLRRLRAVSARTCKSRSEADIAKPPSPTASG